MELLRRWPGQVFVDAHEMGGRQYFFPPNADPIHHEIADEPVSWINGIGEANKAAFGYNGAAARSATRTTRRGVLLQLQRLRPVLHGLRRHRARHRLRRGRHDLREGQRVADRAARRPAVPHPLGDREAGRRRTAARCSTAGRTSGARPRRRASRASCSPTRSSQPGNDGAVPGAGHPHPLVLPAAPTAQLGDVAQAGGAAAADGRRGLPAARRRCGSRTRACSAGAARPATRVPAGAYWIPMDQPQKHWIQATLGEDPYVPFPYFYDVSSWSNPLLMGVPTVYTGDRVRPWAERVRGPEGGVRARAQRARSYEYSLDSSQAGGADVPPARPRRHAAPRRGAQRRLARRRGARRAASTGSRASSASTSSASGRRSRGERVPLRSLGLFAGAGISTTRGLLRRGPVRDRAALAAARRRRSPPPTSTTGPRRVPGPAAR